MNRNFSTLAVIIVVLLGALPARSADSVSYFPILKVAGLPGSGSDVGQYSRLAHDPDGGQHVVYYDASYGDLKYAHRGGPNRAWTVASIDTDGDIGRWCSLAIGPFQDSVSLGNVVNGSSTITITTGTVPASTVIGGKFRVEPSGSWYEIAAVDAATTSIQLVSPYTGASVTGQNFRIRYYQPTLAYQGRTTTSLTLRLAQPSYGGEWSVANLDPPTTNTSVLPCGFETDIAMDSFGRPHVVYQDRASTASTFGRLRYAWFDGYVWRFEAPLGESVTGAARIAIDSADHVWLFCRTTTNYLKSLHYVQGTGWAEAVLAYGDRVGSGLDAMYWPTGDSILLSGQNREASGSDPYIQFMVGVGDPEGNRSWTSQAATLAAPGIGADTTIANGPTTGTQQIVYYDSSFKHLMMTQPTSPGASTYTLPEILDPGLDAGRFCSADVRLADGALYTSYYDAFALGLKMARTAAGVTTLSFIDGDKAGAYSDIGQTSTEIIAPYYNAAEGSLHVARWPIGGVPADGTDIVVDNSSYNVGEFVSMAIDSADRIYLAYYDRANRKVRFAYWNLTEWLTTSIESGGNFGEYCRIALKPTGNELAIAWRDADVQAIAYATVTLPLTVDAQFTLTPAIYTVGVGEQVGRYLSIAWDSGSVLHMSYFSDKKYAPMYSQVTGTSSTLTETIETVSNNVSGWFTSIAIHPADGQPAVAFQDVTHGALKFAKRDPAGAWTVETVDDRGETGFYPVLRFDPARNNQYILYYNQTDGKLRMASRALDCACWRAPLVLAEGTRGVRPAMYLSGAETKITMYHQSEGDLLYMLATEPPVVNAAGPGWQFYR